MLAVVMDGASHMKRSWEEQQARRSPDERPIMQSIADSGGMMSNVPQLHMMHSPSHMLPPIVTAPEQPARQMQTERLMGASSLPGAPQHPSHAQSPHDGSSKRPRLYYNVSYQSDSGRGQPSAHGTPTRTQPTGHERHDQQQWSMGEPQDPEALRRPRDNCPNCTESRGLVEKVVLGLERLEAELRQVLASSPFGRTPKQVSHSTPLLKQTTSKTLSGKSRTTWRS